MILLLAFVFILLLGGFSVIAYLLIAKRHVKFSFLALLIFTLSLLGEVLIYLTLKQGVTGTLKVFLIIQGISPAAMIASAILHNVISALLTSLLKREVEEPFLFLMALFGCPVAFLVGAVGSILLIIKAILL